jgi:predicted transcriptional regulator
MEVPFTPAQEMKLAEIAQHDGTSVADVLVEAAIARIQTEEYFLAKIDRALAQIERGEFIEEEEMDLRVAKMLAR